MARACRRKRSLEARRVFITGAGERRIYLNAAVPDLACDRGMDASACPTCQGGYSELLIHPDQRQCSECRLEQVAIHAMEIEKECDVNLGWNRT